MTYQLDLNVAQNRINRIHSVKQKRAKKLQTVLDNSYSLNSDSLTSLIKKKIMLYNVKFLVRENDFLREINESSRNDPNVLESIFDIINTKDINGNTPIVKAILNDDAKTLEYLLEKATSKIKIYNENSPKHKLYLHNILDTKNNVNKTALQIASESNIKCYNIILKYMELNYKDFSTLDFIPNDVDLSNVEKIKNVLLNTQSLIEQSYSLAIFYYKDSSGKIPSVDKLKYNLIINNVCEAKKNLQKHLFEMSKKHKPLSKKTLETILDTKNLCERLDDVDKNSTDIILSRLKILTDSTNGLTPIMNASKINDYKTLYLLVNTIDSLKKTYVTTYKRNLPNYLDTIDKNYNTALSFAIKNQSIKCIDLLLKFGTTLGNDFEYSKRDSYIIQAINTRNINILKIIIKYYEIKNNDKDSLKNYLCATTKMSNYMTPLEIAIKNQSLDMAILLHDKYNIPIPDKFKEVYKKLLFRRYALIKKKNRNTNFIERIFKNIVNSIISILYFLGIIQFKKRQDTK